MTGKQTQQSYTISIVLILLGAAMLYLDLKPNTIIDPDSLHKIDGHLERFYSVNKVRKRHLHPVVIIKLHEHRNEFIADNLNPEGTYTTLMQDSARINFYIKKSSMNRLEESGKNKRIYLYGLFADGKEVQSLEAAIEENSFFNIVGKYFGLLFIGWGLFLAMRQRTRKE